MFQQKTALLKNTNNTESLSSQNVSKVKSAILSTVHDGAGADSEGGKCNGDRRCDYI